jgi:hypothetical protein
MCVSDVCDGVAITNFSIVLKIRMSTSDEYDQQLPLFGMFLSSKARGKPKAASVHGPVCRRMCMSLWL